MRYSCKESVEYDLKLHYKLRESYIEEIQARSMFKDMRIKIAKSNKGKDYFSIKDPGSDDYVYVGTREEEKVMMAREYAYFRKGLEIIEINIRALERFLDVYRVTKAENINELLTRAYKLPRSSMLLLDGRETDAWLQKKKEEKMKVPVFDPSGLKVTAFDGTKVRSRAEASHLEAFFIYNIPVVFEYPFKINGDTCWPDFLTLDVFLRREAIWEHLGNWFHENRSKREKYRKESIDKWDDYASIGFMPEDNLILTFGSFDRDFNIQAIHRKAAMMAFPPPDEDTIAILRNC